MPSVVTCIVCGSTECASWEHLSWHESKRADAWMRQTEAIAAAAGALLDDYIRYWESGDGGDVDPHEDDLVVAMKVALGRDPLAHLDGRPRPGSGWAVVEPPADAVQPSDGEADG